MNALQDTQLLRVPVPRPRVNKLLESSSSGTGRRLSLKLGAWAQATKNRAGNKYHERKKDRPKAVA